MYSLYNFDFEKHGRKSAQQGNILVWNWNCGLGGLDTNKKN